MDKGSSSGTYIKIKEKSEMKIGDLYECGYLLFEINKIRNNLLASIADVTIVESYKENLDD